MNVLFALSPSILTQLRSAKETRRQQRQLYEVEQQQEDAFLLDPGLGPEVFLTSDGRVLIDGRGWDGGPVREANDDEAVAAIVVGARNLKLPELLALVPPSPSGSVPCPTCEGTRWLQFTSNALRPADQDRGTYVCGKCWGRGWAL